MLLAVLKKGTKLVFKAALLKNIVSTLEITLCRLVLAIVLDLKNHFIVETWEQQCNNFVATEMIDNNLQYFVFRLPCCIAK